MVIWHMNRYDIWHRIWHGHMAEPATLVFLCLLELKHPSSPVLSVEPEKLIFCCCFVSLNLHLLAVLCRLFALCQLKLFSSAIWCLEWVSKLCRLEWVIVFLPIIPSRIACEGMPWCVLLDEWCVFPVLLSPYVANISRKFFFRYHMKLIHSTHILIYMPYYKVILYYHAIAF